MSAQDIFLVIVLVCGVAFIWFLCLLSWFDSFGVADARISFKAFRSFYAINPRRWSLFDSYVCFRDDKCNRTYFRFGLFGYYRYVLWKAKEKRFRKTMESNKKYDDVISQIKKDIEAFEAKSKADTKDALDKIWAHHIKEEQGGSPFET